MPRPGRKRPAGALDRAVELLVANRTVTACAKQLAQEFGCSEATGYNWCKAAYERLGDMDREIKPYRRLQARKRLEHVFYAACDDGKWADALRAQDQLNKIDGIYAPEKLRVDVREIDKMTRAQKSERVAELLAIRERIVGDKNEQAN